MAGDYSEDYGRDNFRPYDRDRSHDEPSGFFNRVGNKLHQSRERLTGDDTGNQAERNRRQQNYGAGPARGYGGDTHYGESEWQSGQGAGYGESQMGRYSPQRASGGLSYRSHQNSSTGYSGRMSDYRGSSQRSDYEAPSGAGSRAYGTPYDDPYGSSASHGFSSGADYGAPAGGYGRSSMGFPRGSDYGSGGSGSMGGGYFGSGAGPWSGGPYSDTGSGGYTPKRSHDRTSEDDYRYSRREQRRRGESDQGYGNPYDR